MKRWMCVAVLMGGCGGGDDTDTDSLTPTTTTTGVDTVDTGPVLTGVTHADLQPIWNNNCGPCHLANFDGGLNVTDGFGSMVAVPSQDVPSMRLVEPFEPDLSYLWHKLNGTMFEVNGSGATMPKGSSLTARQIEMVNVWITEGALEGGD
jgi:hypothetical protein